MEVVCSESTNNTDGSRLNTPKVPQSPQFRYSVGQRVFMYDSYVLTVSAREVQRQFQERFPGINIPSRKTVHDLVKKVRATGSVQDKKRKQQQRRVLTDENLDDIAYRLENSPKTSLRRLSQETGMSYGSVRNATKLLKLKSYKIAMVQELQPIALTNSNSNNIGLI